MQLIHPIILKILRFFFTCAYDYFFKKKLKQNNLLFQGDGLKMTFHKRRGQGRKYEFEGLLSTKHQRQVIHVGSGWFRI